MVPTYGAIIKLWCLDKKILAVSISYTSLSPCTCCPILSIPLPLSLTHTSPFSCLTVHLSHVLLLPLSMPVSMSFARHRQHSINLLNCVKAPLKIVGGSL